MGESASQKWKNFQICDNQWPNNNWVELSLTLCNLFNIVDVIYVSIKWKENYNIGQLVR